MRVLFEFIRIIAIFFIIGGVLGGLLAKVYEALGSREYDWLGFIAVLLLIFVVYRNRWQFSGWYKGNEKLSKKASAILVFGAVVLLLLPLSLSMVN
ncbi:hypothetical protein MUG87_18750 [Ectobacillus sp. JY-23]|uniref:hypothetical protein n=1 Tax=Ectobacillus sp. JY-23 TaxID=2933872 RepID=UPI001FF6C002|nr:hypothetical protein [Ectobacillus sp. JY-23]UOY92431.1 hypothetical protein MUG87_18750 [Ectobacillus sp. JY-23]